MTRYDETWMWWVGEVNDGADGTPIEARDAAEAFRVLVGRAAACEALRRYHPHCYQPYWPGATLSLEFAVSQPSGVMIATMVGGERGYAVFAPVRDDPMLITADADTAIEHAVRLLTALSSVPTAG